MAADSKNNSHVSNYELMETIRKYEAIYNTSGEYHKAGKMLKKDAWAAVATELNIDVAEAQNRYGNIRTVFSRYLKNIRRLQSGGGGPGTGRLGEDIHIKEGFEYLRWLVAHIKPRNTTGEPERGDEAEEGDDMWTGMYSDGFGDAASAGVEGDSDIQVLSHTPSTSHLIPRTVSVSKRGLHMSPTWKKHAKPKARRPWFAMNGAGRTMVEDRGRHSNSNNDEDMMFCLSLAPKMRRLPERYKTAAQLRILQVVCDFEAADTVPPQLPAQTAVVFPSQTVSWQPQGVAVTQAAPQSESQPSSLQH